MFFAHPIGCTDMPENLDPEVRRRSRSEDLDRKSLSPTANLLTVGSIVIGAIIAVSWFVFETRARIEALENGIVNIDAKDVADRLVQDEKFMEYMVSSVVSDSQLMETIDDSITSEVGGIQPQLEREIERRLILNIQGIITRRLSEYYSNLPNSEGPSREEIAEIVASMMPVDDDRVLTQNIINLLSSNQSYRRDFNQALRK